MILIYDRTQKQSRWELEDKKLSYQIYSLSTVIPAPSIDAASCLALSMPWMDRSPFHSGNSTPHQSRESREQHKSAQDLGIFIWLLQLLPARCHICKSSGRVYRRLHKESENDTDYPERMWLSWSFWRCSAHNDYLCLRPRNFPYAVVHCSQRCTRCKCTCQTVPNSTDLS